ncbi:hypothetical protein LEP1GSC193_4363 [Leptospira alstonii serovar Pingchang str. 80-412]|uniref:Uncharacterized protein n=2 Tax=Leptospira alstonii TaxID=28452 RepID=M6CNQ1_9LEPT|nr:hypothetical protein LEP1GSC194_1938 [Leptospira alstonii serovar Sichuan str. 79601]EQA80159.1 hypothetical protein LEP1GSC193_4363 [Leptospira alstonii serovar Pingchang str. 80-412]
MFRILFEHSYSSDCKITNIPIRFGENLSHLIFVLSFLKYVSICSLF